MTKQFTTTSIACPSCNQTSPNYVGKLRNDVTGVIRLPDPGNLYHCENCELFFRRPYVIQSDLIRQYSELSPDFWQRDKSPDFRLAVNTILKSFPFGRILDVGCNRGDFLKMLPETYKKFGLEPSRSSGKIAQLHGITLVGTSIDQIDIEKPTFHAITLLDLIEHLPYPLRSLRKATDLLVPGGLLILSTGNTDSLPWRIMRLDYWYYFSEHVSFFNPRWFNWAGKQLNLKVELLKKFSHFKGGGFERLRQLARCFAFYLVKNSDSPSPLQNALLSVYPFSRAKLWSNPPKAHLWRDHIFVVLRLTA